MTLAYVKNKNYQQPIQILEKYTSTYTTSIALSTLANVYLKAGDIEKWEQTFQVLLKLYPASTGFYYQMAETYASMQDYIKASEYLQKTTSICPGSPLYWFKYAEIKRALNDDENAKRYFAKALTLNPSYYEARDKLRELHGKKSIFSHFPSEDISQLMDTAPTQDEYPEDNAVYLLNDVHRVVYDKGASETEQEILIRAFNGEGIDDLHEYWLPYNSNTEKLIIEKAVVIKADKSEIIGDINNNQIVFKSLENNDFIHIKYKIRNYYSGKLSKHFWDEFLFSRYYPVVINRYALLTPENFRFKYKTQFMPKEPTSVSKTPDGLLYLWQLTNQSAIATEYGMPALVDIGKMLFVSSIEDWSYIVNWYLDLARTKTRSSYEIKEKVSELIGEPLALTDLEKVQRIYNFITNNIRYSSVSFRQSALIPQKARDVLVNKIGDCKDVATLCIAMLKEAGITAQYVLVNTRNEGLNKNILPTIAFNHALVAVELNDSTLYLDLTAQNYPIGSIPTMDIDAFSLLIKKSTTKPFYLSSNYFKRAAIKRNTKISVTEDDAIHSTIETIRSYGLAAGFRNRYRFKGRNEQYKELTEVLTNDYPNVVLENLDIKNLDSNDPELIYRYSFMAPDYISTAGSFKIMHVPWTDNEEALKALSYDMRTFPYLIQSAADTVIEHLTVELPATMVPVELPEPVQLACANAEYVMHLSFENGNIKGIRKLIYKNPEINPDNYTEFKLFFNQVVKTDAQQILLKTK
jgi:tetratricopeptide (TPR) repeat protein